MTRNHVRTWALRPPFRHLSALLLSFTICVVATASAMAGETQRHVVGGTEIQARIDQQLDQEAADRQAIQQLLGQPGVRQIVESVGLDVARAQTAAALLSGSELADLASNAREANAGIGGDRTVTITATTLIIILLIVIILTK